MVLSTRVVIRDKSSYLFDYANSQLIGITREMERLLDSGHRLAQWSKTYSGSNLPLNLSKFEQWTGMSVKILSQSPSAAGKFELIPSKAEKTIVARVTLSQGRVLELTNPELNLSEDRLSDDFSLCVTDSEKKLIFSIERKEYKNDGGCLENLKDFEGNFEEGTRETRMKNHTYLISYRRMFERRALITSSVSKDVAFESAKDLLIQSIWLGLTFLFFSLGITLLILRAITNRIDGLVHYAGEFSQGRFDSGLSPDENQDEISRLSAAFEFMRIKIRSLLVETASKARMEKELEAAEWVQKQFFPAPQKQNSILTIHHTSFSSSECGGDIWQYRKIANRTYFIFGDITGHGMPAALITAVVYGAFNATMNSLEGSKNDEVVSENLLKVAENLNQTIFSSTQGITGLSCLIGVVDEITGECIIHHYAHPPFLTWDPSESRIHLKAARPSSLLGTDQTPRPSITNFNFGESERIILLSDGLFEVREVDGKRFNKKEFIRRLESSTKSGAHAADLLAITEREAREFFGSNQPDDITAVIIENRITPDRNSKH